MQMMKWTKDMYNYIKRVTSPDEFRHPTEVRKLFPLYFSTINENLKYYKYTLVLFHTGH